MEKQYTQDYADKIAKAMEDEKLLEALANAKGIAEIIALFDARGIEMDEEMAQGIYLNISKISENGELDEEMLDAVNGGVVPLIGGIVMVGAGLLTFYVTVKVGCWIVKQIFK